MLRKVFSNARNALLARRSRRFQKRRLTFDRLEARTMLAADLVGDFNNDGIDDIAIGTNEAVGGAVSVMYGTLSGLASANNQLWSQNSSGILDESENGDGFGNALAVGDFNNDGFDDLAVGVTGEEIGGNARAGAVAVIYGSASGLTSAGNQLWSQNSSGILDAAGGTAFGDGEGFGSALAVGDFNNDGTDDLAIGVPNESSVSPYGGAVHIIYGTIGVGLTSTGNQFWTQDSSGIAEESDIEDFFGFALAAGDFDGDGRDDLAVGVPGESLPSGPDTEIFEAGAVSIIYGTDAGLTSARNQFFSQNSSGVQDTAEADDNFGASLAVGNFNGDAYDDLAIGVPREDIDSVFDAGGVNVLYGGDRTFELGATGADQFGLTASGSQFWSQNTSGILDEAESTFVSDTFTFGDGFGASVAAGDLNGDTVDDLVIGVPGESFGSAIGMGAISIIFGSAAKLSSAGNQLWSQDTSGIVDVGESGDLFGATLCLADFNGDNRLDVAVGVPGESIGTVTRAGAVQVIYNSATGLSSSGNQLLHQNFSGVIDESEENEFFGLALPGSRNLTSQIDIPVFVGIGF